MILELLRLAISYTLLVTITIFYNVYRVSYFM
jgi:hypothetical protein